MINRLHIISLSAIGSMSLLAAMISPRPATVPVKHLAATRAEPTQTSEAEITSVDGLVLKADGAGQFHIEANVNGGPVQFLVDTGADVVAITEEQAAGLGLQIMPDQFQPIMQTASGTGLAARVVLDNVEIAGVRLHGVDAVVVKGLPVNLMGQSVLKQLGSVEMKGDTMVLHPR